MCRNMPSENKNVNVVLLARLAAATSVCPGVFEVHARGFCCSLPCVKIVFCCRGLPWSFSLAT